MILRPSATLLSLLTRSALLALSSGMLSNEARAETYLVNPQGTGDFPNLETALAQVVDGDVIELADGEYVGFGSIFDFHGKAITVRSQSGSPRDCRISYSSYGFQDAGFTFQSGEGPGSLLQGVMITAGFSGTPGPRARGTCTGGVGVSVLNGSSPTLLNLLLEENPVGVLACDSSPQLQDCEFNSNGIGVLIVGKSAPFAVASSTFDRNTTGIACEGSLGTVTGCLVTRSGGYASTTPIGTGIAFRLGSSAEVDSCWIQGNNRGVMITESDPTLTNCLITGNGDASPAVFVGSNSNATVRRSTIASNYAYDNDAGGLIVLSSTVQVEQSIIWGNCSYGGGDIHAGSGSTITMTCSLADSNSVSGNVQWLGTNVFEDPYFTEPRNCYDYPTTEGNYCPSEFSPAWKVPGCGNLGAVIANCSVSVTSTSWGQIKALYR